MNKNKQQLFSYISQKHTTKTLKETKTRLMKAKKAVKGLNSTLVKSATETPTKLGLNSIYDKFNKSTANTSTFAQVFTANNNEITTEDIASYQVEITSHPYMES